MRGRRHFLRRLGQTALGLSLGTLVQETAGAVPLPDPDADPEHFWEVVRAQYPVTQERVYLNTGGLGPAPYPVLDAVQRTMMDLQRISETGHDRLEDARVPVAAFFGAKPEEIAFMRNATEGNSTVAMGLDLRKGDEVIFEAHAHPGGFFPWLARQKSHGLVVKLFEPDPTSAEGNLQRIEDLITPRTRVIQVSHVTAPTGIRFPVPEIAALAHDHGCWFHVDGAQSAGMLPVDLAALGCDSYATSGHKWLGAPHGTGVLYVRQDRIDAVRPTETGAYAGDGAVKLPDQFGYGATARRFEPGTRDASSVVGVAAATAFLGRIGMDRIAARGRHLATYLQDGLRALGGLTMLTPELPSLAASITTFKPQRVPFDDLYRFLSDQGLRCRIVRERGIDAVRVSTHLFNSEAECDRVIDATRQALDSLSLR